MANTTKVPFQLWSGLVLLALLTACNLQKQAPQRGLASAGGDEPVQVAPPALAHSYDLPAMHRALMHRGGGGDLLAGFLAASAEQVLEAENLDEIIAQNANRACIYLGELHGIKHRQAVHFEVSDHIGPMASSTNGSVEQQNPRSLISHKDMDMFCKKAAQSSTQELSSYRQSCLQSQKIDVLPMHFTSLECDNESSLGSEKSHSHQHRSPRHQGPEKKGNRATR